MSSKQKEADLLVFGFVNETSEFVVPVAITKLIKQFYYDIIEWRVSDVQIEKIIEKGHVISKEINIGTDLIFDLFIYNPNWSKCYFYSKIYFGFGVREFPSNIKYIDLFISIECATMKKFIICETQRIKKEKNIQCEAQLGDYDLIVYDHLTFICSIDIKKIKYKSVKKSSKQYKSKPN